MLGTRPRKGMLSSRLSKYLESNPSGSLLSDKEKTAIKSGHISANTDSGFGQSVTALKQ